MFNNPTEKTGFVIVLQYMDVRKNIKTRCHPDVFPTQAEAQEQMGIMATESPKLMLYIVEIPLLEYRPRLTAVQ